MYKKILVAMALDHGYGHKAIELARKLKEDDGEIIALHVFEPVHASVSLYVPDGHLAELHKSAKDDILKRIGQASDVKPVTLTGYPWRTISDYAQEIEADCIIVGSHKPGLQDYFLGSTAARIVRHAPCAVHVLR